MKIVLWLTAGTALMLLSLMFVKRYALIKKKVYVLLTVLLFLGSSICFAMGISGFTTFSDWIGRLFISSFILEIIIVVSYSRYIHHDRTRK